MPKAPKPFVIAKRADSNTFQFTLNPACGLPKRVCAEWRRRSFLIFLPNCLSTGVRKPRPGQQPGSWPLSRISRKNRRKEAAIENMNTAAKAKKKVAFSDWDPAECIEPKSA